MIIRLIILLLIWLPFQYNGRARELRFVGFLYEPYGFKENGEDKGAMIEIVKAISKESGIKIKTELYPYPRAVRMIQYGAADFTIMLHNPKNRSFANFASFVFWQNVVVLTKKNNIISSYNDLYDKSKIVGVLRGTNHFSKLINDDKVRKYQIKDFKEGLLMLKTGRISAFLTIDATALYTSKKLGLSDEFAFPGYLVNHMDAWLQVSQNSPRAKEFPYEAIEKAVTKLRMNGTIERIMKEYLGDSYIPQKSPADYP